MSRRVKVKPVECWAPVRANGKLHINYDCMLEARPNNTTGLWNGEPLTYIRVRITPIKAKPTARKGRSRR